MRIIILTQYFHPEIGAPQTRLLELAKTLVLMECEVMVITALPNYPTGKIFDNYKGVFKKKEVFEAIQVYRYWIFPSNSKKAVVRIFNMISFSITSMLSLTWIRKKQPDFLLVESPPLLLGLSAIFLKKWSQCKLVVNISDLWPLTAKEMRVLNDGFFYKLLKVLEKYVYRKSDLITGQSQQILEHIKSIVPNKKIQLFRNGVDPSRFNSQNETSNDKLKLVYAGLFGVAQGVSEVIKEVDFNKLGVELHLYGSGPELKTIKELISSGEMNVYYQGSITRDEIPNVLSKYDGALIPLKMSIYGAVPSKIYEAMASGLPIIFSGGGEGEKIIQNYKCGWVASPSNFEEISRAIEEFTMNEIQRKTFGLNSRKAAVEVFDRRIQIENLYNKLVELETETG